MGSQDECGQATKRQAPQVTVVRSQAISVEIGIQKSGSTCECWLGVDRLGWAELKAIKEGAILVEPNPNTTITAEIVAAYVSHNSIAVADLPTLIADVHSALQRISSGEQKQG